MYGSPYKFDSDSNFRSFFFSFISSKFLSRLSAGIMRIKLDNHHLDHTVHAVDANALNSRCFVTVDRSATEALSGSFIICSTVLVETFSSDHISILSIYSFDIASE
jgi:hypothetical protein